MAEIKATLTELNATTDYVAELEASSTTAAQVAAATAKVRGKKSNKRIRQRFKSRYHPLYQLFESALMGINENRTLRFK